MFLIHKLLSARLRMRELFSEGEYIPLNTSGTYCNSLIAFMRIRGDEAAVVLAPRFMTRVVSEGDKPTGEKWMDTKFVIPDNLKMQMKDAVTGSEFTASGEVFVSHIMTSLPGVLLTGIITER